jgi:two-component system response regulator YesN
LRGEKNSMIKLMIIDDEMAIRSGIRTTIDWNAYGIEVVGEAINGREGLSQALRLKPHIILTDIQMPVMDGLEFVSHIKEQLPQTRIIILTGYDYANYARQAIKFGVDDYLLKPVGAANLTAAIAKIKDQIVKEHERFEHELSKNMIFNEHLPYIRSRFLHGLLTGLIPATDDSFRDKTGRLGIDLSGPYYQVLVIGIDDYNAVKVFSPDHELIKKAVLNVADEVLNGHFISMVFLGNDSRLTAVVNVPGGESPIRNVCRELQLKMTKYLKVTVTIGIGGSRSAVSGLPESYHEAVSAYKNKLYTDKNSIIHIRDVADKPMLAPEVQTAELEPELMAHVKAMRLDEAFQVIDTLFEQFTAAQSDYEQVRNICTKLLFGAVSHLEETGIRTGEALGHTTIPHEFEALDTLSDIKKWLKRLFGELIKLAEHNNRGKYKGIIKIAAEYVAEHYREDIKVEEVAGKVFITPNYFSKLFKEGAGQTFTEFLNDFRVTKAKVLLQDVRLKTSEVAERVGYNDYKYFNYNFKKYAGCTPKEYRSNML